MALDNLQELYVDKLKDLYSAENQIIKALPKMINGASTTELEQALREHLKITEKQAQRLEKIGQDMGRSVKGKKCAGMEGLLEEGSELLKEKPEPDVLNAGIIAAAQSVEHYEIAGYGTAATWAKLLGYDKALALLLQSLDEEKEADKKLTALAKRFVNVTALN
jgi:ferritin-like metal-binding protein YciE